MAKNYDPNKDYAAAIRNESDPGKKEQLKQERQNKIDAMNAAGTNTKGYTNDVYKNSGSGNKTGSTSSGKNNSSGGNKGYYDPNKDYAAAIRNESDPGKKEQLKQERQNKIDAMNAAGTNTGGYTNDIYKNNGGQTVSKDSFGYFDSGKDYAAAINAETDPVKKAQLIQERNNKINYLNATGQNQNGYSNSIYGNGNATSFGQAAEPSVYGQYQNQDAVLQDAALGKLQLTQTENAALANMNTETIDPVATIDYQQVLQNTTDPAQRAALQAYFTRIQSNIDPSEVQGVYAGDTSMSLPDQALLRSYQQMYNEGKASGNQALMDAAAKAAWNLRMNYKEYPTANSNGYNLGENDIGWIRDIVVRVDDLGNKYVDQYNQGTVNTTKYDKDGNFVNQLKGAKIDGHDDYVARQWDRAVENGNEDRWTAIRVADANDVNLSTADLMAKYGAQAGMGRDLYGNARINSKVANGKTLADVYAEQGITGYGQGGAMGTVANGYFDPNKDYAAAIKNASSTQEMLQLQQERKNKIDWMNQTGQNPNGYTNQIYGNYQNIVQQGPQAQQVVQQAAIPTYQGMTRDELYEGYNEAAANLENQRNELLKLTLAQSQAAQDQANTGYDEMARQAYILKRQQEKALPQQLAAMGISGGGSESANLQLQANYQNNLNQNELERQQMLKDYAMQALQAQTQANSDIAGYYADAQQNAMNAWQNEMANKNAWNQWAASYQQGLREYQDQLNNLTYDQIQSNKAQQIDLALKLGDYNKLKALGFDTNYVQRMQDAELEQLALAAAEARSRSVTSGSGGGKKSSSRSSGGGSYSGGGYSGDDVETDVVLGNNSSQLTKNGYTHLVMNYKLLGDTEAFEQKVNELMNNGSVSQADYEKFLKAYS